MNMILECKMNHPYTDIDFTNIELVLVYGAEPYCDYSWALDIRKQCVENHCIFIFVSTGPIFIKDGKTYHIPQNQQEQQARKANINYFPHLDLFERLSYSKFRSSFSLRKREKTYFHEKGWQTINSHAHDFIQERLAPAYPIKDGKQTPMKGHPIFLAQHATGCCCRGCLEKWHHIPKGKELSAKEQSYIVSVLMEWLAHQEKLF